jgi:hypothetical protein
LARNTSQLQPRLFGSAAPLFSVARDAATNNVSPCHLATLGTWDDVIEVEMDSTRTRTAVLAGALVPGKDVGTAKAQLLSRNPIKYTKQNDARHRDRAAQRPNTVRCARCRASGLTPTFEVEGFVVLVDRGCAALVDQREGSAHRRHMNRQKRTVKDKNARVQHRSRVKRTKRSIAFNAPRIRPP